MPYSCQLQKAGESDRFLKTRKRKHEPETAKKVQNHCGSVEKQQHNVHQSILKLSSTEKFLLSTYFSI